MQEIITNELGLSKEEEMNVPKTKVYWQVNSSPNETTSPSRVRVRKTRVAHLHSGNKEEASQLRIHHQNEQHVELFEDDDKATGLQLIDNSRMKNNSSKGYYDKFCTDPMEIPISTNLNTSPPLTTRPRIRKSAQINVKLHNSVGPTGKSSLEKHSVPMVTKDRMSPNLLDHYQDEKKAVHESEQHHNFSKNHSNRSYSSYSRNTDAKGPNLENSSTITSSSFVGCRHSSFPSSVSASGSQKSSRKLRSRISATLDVSLLPPIIVNSFSSNRLLPIIPKNINNTNNNNNDKTKIKMKLQSSDSSQNYTLSSHSKTNRNLSPIISHSSSMAAASPQSVYPILITESTHSNSVVLVPKSQRHFGKRKRVVANSIISSSNEGSPASSVVFSPIIKKIHPKISLNSKHLEQLKNRLVDPCNELTPRPAPPPSPAASSSSSLQALHRYDKRTIQQFILHKKKERLLIEQREAERQSKRKQIIAQRQKELSDYRFKQRKLNLIKKDVLSILKEEKSFHSSSLVTEKNIIMSDTQVGQKARADRQKKVECLMDQVFDIQNRIDSFFESKRFLPDTLINSEKEETNQESPIYDYINIPSEEKTVAEIHFEEKPIIVNTFDGKETLNDIEMVDPLMTKEYLKTEVSKNDSSIQNRVDDHLHPVNSAINLSNQNIVAFNEYSVAKATNNPNVKEDRNINFPLVIGTGNESSKNKEDLPDNICNVDDEEKIDKVNNQEQIQAKPPFENTLVRKPLSSDVKKDGYKHSDTHGARFTKAFSSKPPLDPTPPSSLPWIPFVARKENDPFSLGSLFEKKMTEESTKKLSLDIKIRHERLDALEKRADQILEQNKFATSRLQRITEQHQFMPDFNLNYDVNENKPDGNFFFPPSVQQNISQTILVDSNADEFDIADVNNDYKTMNREEMCSFLSLDDKISSEIQKLENLFDAEIQLTKLTDNWADLEEKFQKSQNSVDICNKIQKKSEPIFITKISKDQFTQVEDRPKHEDYFKDSKEDFPSIHREGSDCIEETSDADSVSSKSEIEDPFWKQAFSTKSSGFVNFYLEKERSRFRDNEALIRLKKRTLKDQVKAELAYLREQRRQLMSSGAQEKLIQLNMDMERSIKLRYATEKAELTRKLRRNLDLLQSRQKLLQSGKQHQNNIQNDDRKDDLKEAHFLQTKPNVCKTDVQDHFNLEENKENLHVYLSNSSQSPSESISGSSSASSTTTFLKNLVLMSDELAPQKRIIEAKKKRIAVQREIIEKLVKRRAETKALDAQVEKEKKEMMDFLKVLKKDERLSETGLSIFDHDQENDHSMNPAYNKDNFALSRNHSDISSIPGYESDFSEVQSEHSVFLFENVSFSLVEEYAIEEEISCQVEAPRQNISVLETKENIDDSIELLDSSFNVDDKKPLELHAKLKSLKMELLKRKKAAKNILREKEKMKHDVVQALEEKEKKMEGQITTLDNLISNTKEEIQVLDITKKETLSKMDDRKFDISKLIDKNLRQAKNMFFELNPNQDYVHTKQERHGLSKRDLETPNEDISSIGYDIMDLESIIEENVFSDNIPFEVQLIPNENANQLDDLSLTIPEDLMQVFADEIKEYTQGFEEDNILPTEDFVEKINRSSSISEIVDSSIPLEIAPQISPIHFSQTIISDKKEYVDDFHSGDDVDNYKAFKIDSIERESQTSSLDISGKDLLAEFVNSDRQSMFEQINELYNRKLERNEDDEFMIVDPWKLGEAPKIPSIALPQTSITESIQSEKPDEWLMEKPEQEISCSQIAQVNHGLGINVAETVTQPLKIMPHSFIEPLPSTANEYKDDFCSENDSNCNLIINEVADLNSIDSINTPRIPSINLSHQVISEAINEEIGVFDDSNDGPIIAKDEYRQSPVQFDEAPQIPSIYLSQTPISAHIRDNNQTFLESETGVNSKDNLCFSQPSDQIYQVELEFQKYEPDSNTIQLFDNLQTAQQRMKETLTVSQSLGGYSRLTYFSTSQDGIGYMDDVQSVDNAKSMLIQVVPQIPSINFSQTPLANQINYEEDFECDAISEDIVSEEDFATCDDHISISSIEINASNVQEKIFILEEMESTGIKKSSEDEKSPALSYYSKFSFECITHSIETQSNDSDDRIDQGMTAEHPSLILKSIEYEKEGTQINLPLQESSMLMSDEHDDKYTEMQSNEENKQYFIQLDIHNTSNEDGFCNSNHHDAAAFVNPMDYSCSTSTCSVTEKDINYNINDKKWDKQQDCHQFEEYLEYEDKQEKNHERTALIEDNILASLTRDESRELNSFLDSLLNKSANHGGLKTLIDENEKTKQQSYQLLLSEEENTTNFYDNAQFDRDVDKEVEEIISEALESEIFSEASSFFSNTSKASIRISQEKKLSDRQQVNDEEEKDDLATNEESSYLDDAVPTQLDHGRFEVDSVSRVEKDANAISDSFHLGYLADDFEKYDDQKKGPENLDLNIDNGVSTHSQSLLDPSDLLSISVESYFKDILCGNTQDQLENITKLSENASWIPSCLNSEMYQSEPQENDIDAAKFKTEQENSCHEDIKTVQDEKSVELIEHHSAPSDTNGFHVNYEEYKAEKQENCSLDSQPQGHLLAETETQNLKQISDVEKQDSVSEIFSFQDSSNSDSLCQDFEKQEKYNYRVEDKKSDLLNLNSESNDPLMSNTNDEEISKVEEMTADNDSKNLVGYVDDLNAEKESSKSLEDLKDVESSSGSEISSILLSIDPDGDDEVVSNVGVIKGLEYKLNTEYGTLLPLTELNNTLDVNESQELTQDEDVYSDNFSLKKEDGDGQILSLQPNADGDLLLIEALNDNTISVKVSEKDLLIYEKKDIHQEKKQSDLDEFALVGSETSEDPSVKSKEVIIDFKHYDEPVIGNEDFSLLEASIDETVSLANSPKKVKTYAEACSGHDLLKIDQNDASEEVIKTNPIDITTNADGKDDCISEQIEIETSSDNDFNDKTEKQEKNEYAVEEESIEEEHEIFDEDNQSGKDGKEQTQVDFEDYDDQNQFSNVEELEKELQHYEEEEERIEGEALYPFHETIEELEMLSPDELIEKISPYFISQIPEEIAVFIKTKPLETVGQVVPESSLQVLSDQLENSRGLANRATLVFESLNEAFSHIYRPYEEQAMKEDNPYSKIFASVPLVGPIPMTIAHSSRMAMNSMKLWATNFEKYQDNVDMILLDDIKEEEKRWNEIEHDCVEVEHYISDMIFEELIDELVKDSL